MLLGRALALLWLACSACSAARPLRPLQHGAFAAELSAPGVWVKADRTFPVAAPVVGIRYGARDDVEAVVRCYPLLLPLRLVGIELGAVWHARPANGLVPAVHLEGDLSSLSAPGHVHEGLAHAARGGAALTTTVHWEPVRWLWPYLVQQNALVLAERRYISSVFAGLQVAVSERVDLSLETGIAAVNTRSRDYTQPYVGVLGRGALSMSAGIAYRFGGGAPAR